MMEGPPETMFLGATTKGAGLATGCELSVQDTVRCGVWYGVVGGE